MPDEPIKVIAAAGATSSGKSDLSVYLAKALDGEVISADSMQIYKGMDIATAKITEDEMDGVKHHLISFLDPSREYSAALFKKDAENIIYDIDRRGKVPIICGGTGLYIDSLLKGFDFSYMPEDLKIRSELKKRADSEGAEPLLNELKDIDPETASKLSLNDEKRIIRALEVYYITGEKFSKRKEKTLEGSKKFDSLYIIIDFSDRRALYRRIDERVDKMIENGLVEEAKKFIDKGPTSRQAIGYKELVPYFKNEKSLDECVENIKKSTRRYAKRQITWFKRNRDAFRVDPAADPGYKDAALNEALKFLNGK